MLHVSYFILHVSCFMFHGSYLQRRFQYWLFRDGQAKAAHWLRLLRMWRLCRSVKQGPSNPPPSQMRTLTFFKANQNFKESAHTALMVKTCLFGRKLLHLVFKSCGFFHFERFFPFLDIFFASTLNFLPLLAIFSLPTFFLASNRSGRFRP